MNVSIFNGRFTKNPEMSYSGQGEKAMAIARGTIAVKRGFSGKEGQPEADFFPITAFGVIAESLEKYCRQGSKVIITSHFQTSTYTDKEGKTQYGHTFVVDKWEFDESKAEAEARNGQPQTVPQPQAQAVPQAVPQPQVQPQAQAVPQAVPQPQVQPQPQAVIDPSNLGFY